MADVSVAQLWRFPVKSLGGTRVDEVRIDKRGVHADRLWALRDLDNDVTASARRLPALLTCTARYAQEAGLDAGPGNVPEVIITLPDGTEVSSADPLVHQHLSDIAGRPVRLTALAPTGDTSQHRLSVQQSRANFAPTEVRRDFGLSDAEALPDTSMFSTKEILTLARYSTPPGTFVDLSPVHLLSTTSLASLAPGADAYDVRRFRPNVLMDISRPGTEFPEADWCGAQVQIGTAGLRVTTPTIRCVVPTRPQPGVELDRALTRQLKERTDRFLGVYADVTRPGVLRVGDAVHVHRAAPPGPVRRVAQSANKAIVRQVQHLLEATILKEK